MAINAGNLDSDLFASFFENDKTRGMLRNVTLEDAARYLHQNQEDALAKGSTSEEVKKFFDYMAAHVFLPWLNALSKATNYNAQRSTRFLILAENAEGENPSVIDSQIVLMAAEDGNYDQYQQVVAYNPRSGELYYASADDLGKEAIDQESKLKKIAGPAVSDYDPEGTWAINGIALAAALLAHNEDQEAHKTRFEELAGKIKVGKDGVTFTPSVSADGVLSWTNDGGLPNPEDVNLKGPDGYTPVKGKDFWTEEDKSEIAQPLANAFKGNVSGEIIRVDDVSPVEHTVDVKVRSKNLVPSNYADTTGTIAGVTYTVYDDGKLEVSGVTTAGTSFNFARNQTIEVGTYTMSDAKNLVGINFLVYDVNNKKLICLLPASSESKTFTVTEKIENASLYLNTSATGTTVSGYIYPQIEKGSVATEYTPFVDIGTVNVNRYSGNLLDLSKFVFSSSVYNAETGIATSNIVNGYFCSFSSADPEILDLFYANKGESFCFSIKERSSLTAFFEGDRSSLDKDYEYYEANNSGENYLTFTVPSDFVNITRVEFRFNRFGQAITDTTTQYSEFMLNCGTSVLPYEPYKEPMTATAEADGTVKGVMSLYPTTTLTTDTTGVVMDVEYNRDTNKAVRAIVDEAKSEIEEYVNDTILGGEW